MAIPIDFDSQLTNFDVNDAAACEKVWLEVKAKKCPRARASHAAVVIDNFRFVVVGGGACSSVGLWMHFGDAHVFDARTQKWEELLISADSEHGMLPPRRGHTAARWHDEVIILFGGTCGSQDPAGLLNDTWTLDVSGRQWRKLETSGNTPMSRRHASSCFAGDHFVVVGGMVYPDPRVFLLEPISRVWTIAVTTGDPLPAFAMAGSAVIGNSLFIFGGFPPAGLLRLDVVVSRDKKAATPPVPTIEAKSYKIGGAVPCPRFCHGVAALGSRWLVVFGGTEEAEDIHDDPITLNDCYLLDLIDQEAATRVSTWAVARQVTVRGSREPQERNGFSMVALGTKMVVFGGGIFKEVYYDDTWVLDLRMQPTVAINLSLKGSRMGDDLRWLLESEQGASLADLTVVVGEGDVRRTFIAHRAILCARSEYFCALLTRGFSESTSSTRQIFLPDCEPTVFESALTYMYTGDVPLAEMLEMSSEERQLDLDLFSAVRDGYVHGVRQALVMGADPNSRTAKHSTRPLHAACQKDIPEQTSREIVGCLVVAGADFHLAVVTGGLPVALARQGIYLDAAADAEAVTAGADEVEVAPAAVEKLNTGVRASLEPVVHVLHLADRLGLEHLALLCESALAKHVRRANIWEMFAISHEYNCQQLRLICIHFYKRHPYCMRSPLFKLLPTNLRDEIIWNCQGM